VALKSANFGASDFFTCKASIRSLFLVQNPSPESGEAPATAAALELESNDG